MQQTNSSLTAQKEELSDFFSELRPIPILDIRGRHNISYYQPVPVKPQVGVLRATSVDSFIHLSCAWNNHINILAEKKAKKLFVCSRCSRVVGKWLN